MALLKLVSFLAFAYVCGATDVEQAKWIMECARKSIVKGVPDLHIPNHEPLVFSKGYQLNISSGESIELKNIAWYNLSTYTFDAGLRNHIFNIEDTFNVTMTWKEFKLTADYTLTNSGNSGEEKQTGTISATFADVIWSGLVRILKPILNNKNVNFIDVQMVQRYLGPEVDVPNNKKMANEMRIQIRKLFNLPHFNKVIAAFLNAQFAQQPERVEKLIQWCKNQGD